MTLLDIRDLQLEFSVGKDTVYALRGVTLRIPKGTKAAIVGESGSGKSVTAISTLRLLPRTAHVTGGQIVFDGTDLLTLSERDMHKLRGAQIGMVFQNASASLNPLFTVGSQIATVYRYHTGSTKKEAWAKAVEVLKDTGIPDPEDRARNYPFEFSGGMAQRAMIAMALVCSPQLLIADEPTSGLDVTIQVQVLDLIQDVVDRLDATLMLISHDMALVSAVCDHVIVMYAGTVMESGSVDQVLDHPANPYTILLLECFTHTDSEEMPTIPGRVPDLRERWPGCGFATRCPRAQDICRQEKPPAIEIEPGHYSTCHFADQL
jgi:peptide/nickel transport system ATP-binding protein